MKVYTVELDDDLSREFERGARQARRTPEELLRLIADKYVYGDVGRDYAPVTAEELATFRTKTPRITITAKERNRIFERCRGKCAYCEGIILFSDPYHIDHIHPLSKGGSNDESNLTLSCVACNVRKRDKLVAVK